MNTYGENERMSDFNFFVEHYDELFEKYGHKFIVIRYHEILGAYDTLESAINETSQSHQLGTYIVKECNGDESGYTNYVSSWQLMGV